MITSCSCVEELGIQTSHQVKIVKAVNVYVWTFSAVIEMRTTAKALTKKY